jgi:hypothetical protein
VFLFFIIYIVSSYSCELKSHSWRGVLDTTLCDTVAGAAVVYAADDWEDDYLKG